MFCSPSGSVPASGSVTGKAIQGGTDPQFGLMAGGKQGWCAAGAQFRRHGSGALEVSAGKEAGILPGMLPTHRAPRQATSCTASRPQADLLAPNQLPPAVLLFLTLVTSSTSPKKASKRHAPRITRCLLVHTPAALCPADCTARGCSRAKEGVGTSDHHASALCRQIFRDHVTGAPSLP